MEEIWKTIPGFSEDYEVSNLGRVRSWRTKSGKRAAEPHLLTQHLNRKGYPQVGLQVAPRKQRPSTVHRLVALAFIGPRPEGYEVAHCDGDSTNARPENLRYATRLENAADKQRHGTTAWGEGSGHAKLTAGQVTEIYARRQSGEKVRALAKEFGIAVCTVSSITCGRSWKRLGLVNGSAFGEHGHDEREAS